jgi:hypothetical protein
MRKNAALAFVAPDNPRVSRRGLLGSALALALPDDTDPERTMRYV